MKKILIFCLFCTVFSVQSQSDLFNIYLGEPYKVIDADEKSIFLLNNKVVMFKRNTKLKLGSFNQPIDITVQVYDIARKKEIIRNKHTHEDKTDILEGYRIIADKLHLFFSRWDKNNESEQLFYKIFDINNGTFGSEKLIVKSNGKISRKGMYDFGKFFIYPSFNKSKYLILYRKRPESVKDKINKDIIGMNVFDANFEAIWGREEQMLYTEKQMNIIDYQVDNSGNVFQLASINDKGRIIVYSESDKREIDINSNKHTLVNAIIFDGIENNLYLVGAFCKSCDKNTKIYSHLIGFNKDNVNIDGAFINNLNSSYVLGDYMFYEPPIDLVQFAENDKTIKNIENNIQKKLSLIPNASLKEVEILEDESFIFHFEVFMRHVRHSTDSKGNSKTKIFFESGADYVFKFNKESTLIWANKLPKKVFCPVPSMVVSKRFYHEGKHYVFYVDHPKNALIPIESTPILFRRGQSGGVMMVYVIDDITGNVTKHFLFDFNKIPDKNGKLVKGFQFSTYRIQKSPTGFVFEVYIKNKLDAMIHLDF